MKVKDSVDSWILIWGIVCMSIKWFVHKLYTIAVIKALKR